MVKIKLFQSGQPGLRPLKWVLIFPLKRFLTSKQDFHLCKIKLKSFQRGQPWVRAHLHPVQPSRAGLLAAQRLVGEVMSTVSSPRVSIMFGPYEIIILILKEFGSLGPGFKRFAS